MMARADKGAELLAGVQIDVNGETLNFAYSFQGLGHLEEITGKEIGDLVDQFQSGVPSIKLLGQLLEAGLVGGGMDQDKAVSVVPAVFNSMPIDGVSAFITRAMSKAFVGEVEIGDGNPEDGEGGSGPLASDGKPD